VYGEIVMIENLKLFNDLQNVWWKVDSAKSLVDDGKEVLCSNRLQGALATLKIIIEDLGKEVNQDGLAKKDLENSGNG